MTDRLKDNDGSEELAKVWLPVPGEDECDRKRTGRSIKELLAQAIPFMHDAETGSDRYEQSGTEQSSLRIHADSDEASLARDGE